MFLCTERKWKNVNYLYRVFSIKADTTNHLQENAFLLLFNYFELHINVASWEIG
jgi:hypothetical protein